MNEYLDYQRMMYAKLNAKMDKMSFDFGNKFDDLASHIQKVDQ